ncbi:unnamed protein product [Medioppia subpectinata]|uniref:Heat shock protein 70 n=1 Tax=Medioppia subpectinata TaxID=1979941 RepID=A0A7R9KKM6_9ACAR|nr:unnamed protein product [Medioppia subpectinata]CAG2105194.1 unnamed protein product [Medioppia subpectinata]
MNVEITRRQFNDMCEHLFARTMACVNDVMGKAGKTPRDIDDVILVGGSTRIPYVQEMLAEFFDKEPCHTVHPDLAVAEGAAIQAAILNGNQAQQLGNLRVRDVTPFTLGVRGQGDTMSPIIVAQSPIPCSKAKVYRTVKEFQTDIDVVVYEGEDPVASANRQLGTFTVAGLPPLPAGRATIKVVFDLNDDGILNVRAVDPITGQAIAGIEVVEHKGRLTEQELRERAV